MFIFSILGVWLLGLFLARSIKPGSSLTEYLGLSFLLGMQLFTLTLFVANYFFGVRLNLSHSWLILLGLLISTLAWAKFSPPFEFKLPGWPKSKLSQIFIFTLVLIFGSNLLVSFWRPVVDWDAVNMFDYRAKIILHTGWIKDTQFRAPFISYPLFTTLSHYWLEANLAPTAMPIYPMFYACFVLVSYSLLRRSFSQNIAFVGVLLLASAPKMFDQSLIAYTNLPYTIYLILGAAYIYYWTKTRNKYDLILGVLLSLLSLWVRTFPFALANIIAALLLSLKIKKPFIYLGLFLGFILSAKIFWPFNLPQLLNTLSFTKWAVFYYYSPYPWVFVLLTLYALVFSANKLNYWLVTILFYFLIYISGNYYYAGINPEFAGLPDAAQRMTMFLGPAIIWLVISHLTAQDFKSSSKQYNTGKPEYL